MIKSWNFENEYKLLKKDVLKKIDNILKNGNLFFGNEILELEKKVSLFNKSKFAIGVGSGTDALYLSLKAKNIGLNDEVITVANTAIPTISAIIKAGASPVLVDIGTDYLIDINKIESVITKKTKAIIPVHLYGQSCEMGKILQLAKKYRLSVIEDCAQAQGAKYRNKYVGSFGITGCFSFYPTKILGAYGDGGIITTNDQNLNKKIRRLRFYGMEQMDKKKWWNNKYYSEENGTNSRIDEIQSGILNIKFKYLNKWIKRRREIAKIYNNNIKNIDIKKPFENKNNYHVYHLYVVAHEKRELIFKEMKKNNINLSIQYPYPIHKMKAYKNLSFKGNKNLVNSENFSKKIFSLPIYPLIENKKIYKIIKILNKL